MRRAPVQDLPLADGPEQSIDLRLVGEAPQAKNSRGGALVRAEPIVDLNCVLTADDDRGPQSSALIGGAVANGFHVQVERLRQLPEEALRLSFGVCGDQQPVRSRLDPIGGRLVLYFQVKITHCYTSDVRD